MSYQPGKNNTRSFVNEHKLKEQMCDIGRRIWLKGFCAGNEGNHSYRMSENRFLCTPTGVSKGNLKPDDICVVDGTGKQISGKLKRTSEFMLHAAIYNARPDVNAIVHSHPPHATAFAVAGVEIPTCIHPEAEVFLGPVKTAKYVTPGDQRLGESILPYVKESNTIILQSHGVVCFNADLEQAYYQLEIIDAYSRILLLAKGLGSVKTLSGDEMSELIRLKERVGLADPRITEAKTGPMSCSASDFISRVGGEAGTRGRMMVGPVATSLMSSLNTTVSGQITPEQFEAMVQVITDQIMEAV
jgi:L-fuculose-phosphate aldolase